MHGGQHGYDFGEGDLDWRNMVPVFSNRPFPGNAPSPPQQLTEEEKAMQELRDMNMNAGFIMTYPLPEDTPRLPGSGPTPSKRRSATTVTPKHSPSTRMESLEDELKNGSLRRSTRKSKASRPRPSAPRSQGYICSACSTPNSRFCPETGKQHHKEEPKPTIPSASRSQPTPPPSQSASEVTAPVTPSPASTPTRSLTAALEAPSPTQPVYVSSRIDELLAAQVREEELERQQLLGELPAIPSNAPTPSRRLSTPPTSGVPPSSRRSATAAERSISALPASVPTRVASPIPPVRASPVTRSETTTPQVRRRQGLRSTTPFATSYNGPSRGNYVQQNQATRNGAGEWELNDWSYENLLELGSMAVCTGLSKAQMAMYRPQAYTQPPAGVTEEECIICLEVLQQGEPTLRIVCKHIFHHKCVTEWLAKSNKCPTCRFEIPRKEKLVIAS